MRAQEPEAKGSGTSRAGPNKEGELDSIPSSQDEFNSTNTYLMPLTGSWG